MSTNDIIIKERMDSFVFELDKLAIPFFKKGVTSIYEHVKRDNKQKNKLLLEFQHALRNISSWSSEVKEKEWLRLHSCDPKSEYYIHNIFDLKCSLLQGNAPKVTELHIEFVHECYLNIARALWKNPYLVYDVGVSVKEKQEKQNVLEKLIKKSIKHTFISIVNKYIVIDESCEQAVIDFEGLQENTIQNINISKPISVVEDTDIIKDDQDTKYAELEQDPQPIDHPNDSQDIENEDINTNGDMKEKEDIEDIGDETDDDSDDDTDDEDSDDEESDEDSDEESDEDSDDEESDEDDSEDSINIKLKSDLDSEEDIVIRSDSEESDKVDVVTKSQIITDKQSSDDKVKVVIIDDYHHMPRENTKKIVKKNIIKNALQEEKSSFF